MSDFKRRCPSKPRGRALSGLFALFLLMGIAMIVVMPCAADTGGSTAGTFGDTLSDPGARTWSYDVDLSTFKPDEYIVKASVTEGDTTGTILFNVLEGSSTGTGTVAARSPGATSPASGYYYITIDPIGDRHVGDKFTITGRTNLPEGTDILVEVYASSFKPTSKSQSGEFSGATGTVKVSDSAAGRTVSSYDSQPPAINSQVVPAPLTTLSPDPGVVGTDAKIIKTATVSLEVTNTTETAATLHALAVAQGGYVSSSDIETSGGRHYGTVALRIPQARFETTLSGVKSVGTVKSVSTKGDDVTEEYVDLLAQKKAYEAQLSQYYVLMKKAVKISDILAIQQQIDRVQTELNRLEGRLKYLNNRIDLSTITITLNEPVPIMAETDQSPGHNFVVAVNKGISGLFGFIDIVIESVITFLPIIIVAGAGIWLYLRRRGKKPAHTAAVKELTQQE